MRFAFKVHHLFWLSVLIYAIGTAIVQNTTVFEDGIATSGSLGGAVIIGLIVFRFLIIILGVFYLMSWAEKFFNGQR